MDKLLGVSALHGITAEKFLYFFLGLRKADIRRRVENLRARYPDESADELARRLIRIQSKLSLAGGALLHVPMFVPAMGPMLKLLGLAGSAVVLMQMHMALVLEIALLYGQDIEKPQRLKEIAAIIIASGLVACTPLLTRAMNMKSYYALLTGGMTVSTASQLIGDAAILYYRKAAHRKAEIDASAEIKDLLG
jgi:hypothetical protein